MKTPAVLGSRNPEGRTARAADALLRGAQQAGAEVERVFPTGLTVERCRRCDERGAGPARLTAHGLAITRCLYRSARHALEFGLLMERAQPREGLWQLGERYEGDPERTQVYRIVRDELDNCLRLIDLLRKEETGEVLVTASTSEEEDTFILGPDLIDQLRRKREIMLRHWSEFDRLFLPPHL